MLQTIIAEAKKHVHGWEFCELASVGWTRDFTAGGLWYPPKGERRARIELGWEQDPEVLWHEVFHSVFHNCPLRAGSPEWGEAFCNAFSEATRYAPFRETIVSDDLEKIKTDTHWRKYIVPCTIILRHVNFSQKLFASFWERMNARARYSPTFRLTDYFGYCPETGAFDKHAAPW